MEETIKAVGYARFSSSMQREESITAQKRYMMMYAKRNNMEVIDWFVMKQNQSTDLHFRK